MFATICLAIVLLSLLAFHVSTRYSKAGRMFDKIPGPTTLPIVGNLLMFSGSTEYIWNAINQSLDKYYPILRVWFGTITVLLLRHPDDMKVLLSCKKNIDKSDVVYSILKSIGNDGLVSSKGDKWRPRRKLINPAFNPQLLKVYFFIINEHTEKLLKRIKSQNAESTLDLKTTLSKLTLGIICEATMGVDPNDFGIKEEEEFRHTFDEVGDIILNRTFKPYLKEWMIKFLNIGRRQERALKRGRVFVNKIIQERREYHEKFGYDYFQSDVNGDISSLSTISGEKKRLSVLDLLLAAEKENLIDEKGVKEEAETMLLAGYDTVSLAMTFALMVLAENKAMQKIARNEVTELLSQTNGVLTIADVNKFDYLERFIKETLRLYPSAPLIGRFITDDIKLGNFEIPHNTQAFMNIYSLHRDSNFWPDPEKFDPNRFLPENIKDRHPFAFVPFSAGLRSCIGQKFAMLEMKAVLARILYNFYLEPVDSTANLKFQLHITLHTKDQRRIKLIKINREPPA